MSRSGLMLLSVACLSFSAAGGVEPLSLTVSSKQTRLLRYEPLTVTLTLRNETNKAVMADFALGRRDDTLYIIDPSGAEIAWRRSEPHVGRLFEGAEQPLEPGAEVTYSFECSWKDWMPILSETGTNQLVAYCPGTAGRLKSAPHEVTVIEGSERDNACLEALLKDGLVGHLLLQDALPSVPRDISLLDKFTDVLEKFEDSRYAAYCATSLLSLLEYEVVILKRREGREVEATRIDRALAAVEKLLKSNPHPRVLAMSARLLAKKDPERAGERIKQAEALGPDPLTQQILAQARHKLRPSEE